MKRTIVVGVDGSTVSIAALRWAIDEATRRGCSVTAVNAWHSDPTTAGLSRLDLIQLRPRDEVMDAQWRVVAGAVTDASDVPGVEIIQQLLEGQPGRRLSRLPPGLICWSSAATATAGCTRHCSGR